MASPWQFSPYLPSPSKCSAARSHGGERAYARYRQGGFAAIRDRDPEPALLQPYAMAGRCAGRHRPPRCDASCSSVARTRLRERRPCKEETSLSHDRAGSFALRISALSHFRRKSPVCLPSTVYKAGSTTWRRSDREFDAGPGTRRAVPSLTRDVRSAAFDASGIAPYRSLRVLAFASPCPHLETASAVLDDRPALTNAPSWRRSVVVADFRPPPSRQRISKTRHAQSAS